MTSVDRPLTRILETNPRRVEHENVRVPEKEYLILFSARTGSSHLTELLESAQVGDPREWLNPAFMQGQAEFFGATNFRDYFSRMRSRYSPRGVFGHEMTIWFYEAFSREVRLEDHFNFEVPCVILFRENIVEQAVSLYFAAQRNHFHNTGEPSALRAVSYDAAAIRHLVQRLMDEERRLKAFVSQKALLPKFISYEILTTSDPKAVVEAFACLVGITAETSTLRSRHQKLGDTENLRQAQQFIAEHAHDCDSISTNRQWLKTGLQLSPLMG